MEYFNRRPYGWQEDNRAAVIAMSLGGSDKVKPEDLFVSLRVLREAEQKEESSRNTAASFAKAFFRKVSSRLTQENPFSNAD